MSSDEHRSIWPPLDHSKSEIRLLRLRPDGELGGSLETRSLKHHPRYDAISHAWGRPDASEVFNLGDGMMLIPQRLAACLNQFRRTFSSTLFWVDAICIAQNDVDERAQQVQLMQQIFSYAVTVRAWLGQGSPDFYDGFKSIFECARKISRIRKPVLLTFTEGSDEWKAIAALADTDWWHRLWITQEVALARELVLHYSDQAADCSLLWEFLLALNLGDAETEAVRFGPSTQQRECSRISRDFVDVIRHLVRVARLMRLLYDYSSALDSTKAETLVALLAQNRLKLASDPRDRVFGLLGICDAFFGDFLIPNYSISTAEVYTDFTWRLVQRSGSLAVLNQASNGLKAADSLPSWVPDWNSSHEFSTEYFRLLQWPQFDASKSLCHTSTSTMTADLDGRSLVVQTRILGEVEDTCCTNFTSWDQFSSRLSKCSAWYDAENPISSASGSEIAQFLVPLGAWSAQAEIKGESKIEVSYQITAAGRRHVRQFSWSPSDPNAAVRRALLAMLLFRGTLSNDSVTVMGSTNYARIRNPLEAMDLLEAVDNCSPMLARQESVSVSDRRLARSLHLAMRQGALFRYYDERVDHVEFGAGPLMARSGDSVALLAGATVPFILRKSGDQDGRETYSVVGEAYVQGRMDGEGCLDAQGNRLPFKEICLV